MSGPDLEAFGKFFATIAGAFAQIATAANNNPTGVLVAIAVLLGAYIVYARRRRSPDSQDLPAGTAPQLQLYRPLARLRVLSRPLNSQELSAETAPHQVYRPSARLRVLSGPLKGEVLLFDGSVMLGRDPRKAQLTFPPNSLVSRSHCAVRFESAVNRFRVKDLGSKNRTLLVKGSGAKILLLPFIERGAAPGDRLVLARTHEVIMELAR